MDGPGLWIEPDWPAFLPKPLAPVHVFAIHEKALIERPNLLERFPARQPESPAKYVNISRRILVKMPHVISSVQRAARKKPVKGEGTTKHIPETGKTPARNLRLAVCFQEQRPDHAEFRLSFHLPQQRGNATLEHFHIGVDQTQIPAPSHLQARVVRPCKPKVLGVLHENNPWESLPNRLRRADRKSTRLNSSHANISYAVF